MTSPPTGGGRLSRSSLFVPLLATATAATYATLFGTAWAAVGPAVGAFGLLPVVLVAWHGGTRWGGAFGVFVGGPLHLALYGAAMPELGLPAHLAGTVPTAVVFGLVGAGLGWIRRLSRAVRTSEAQFRGTFENAAVGIAHVAPDGTWLRTNGRLGEIVGYPSEELLGLTFQDLTHPDDLDADLALLQRVLAGEIDEYQPEKRYVRKDRSVVAVQLTVSASRAADGDVDHLISVVEDVSDKKVAEAAVHASEARYRDLVETIREAVLQTDVEGRWTYLNPAWERITGFPIATSLGRPVLEFVHPDERGRHNDLFGPLVRQEVPFVRFETRYLTRDGGTRHVEVHAQLRRDEAGAVLGVTGTVADVTDAVRFEAEREAREQTEEMLRLKSSFLQNMSHELRTPLTGILGFADILADEAPADLQEPVAIIQRGAERLMATLTSVLDLAQLESAAVRLHPEVVDLAAEAREVAEGLGALAASRGLRLSVSGDAQAVLDRSALHRVLTNLVGNALKFTDCGGVEVRAESGAGCVRLVVADTGRGIAPAFLPHLFDEFRQASEGLDREHEGNGLGLTITKRLVDLMGGTIRVESEPGAGTTFTVSLPIVPTGADGPTGLRAGRSPSRETAGPLPSVVG